MQVEWIRLGPSELLSVRGEAASGPVGPQLAALLLGCEVELAQSGFGVRDIMFQRLWLSARELREEASLARAAFFNGDRRAGSSSFQCAGRFAGPGGAAIEILALRGRTGTPKRLVEFAEPRRYPHYVVRDDLMFVSGMAELASTAEEQLRLSIAQVEVALAAEGLTWRDVIEAHMFVQRGTQSPDWLRAGLDAAAQVRIGRVTCEQVDGLATPGKVLEIEVVARKP